MQKLALSTSFTSNRPHTGKTLLDSFKQFNVTGLELDYRIGEVLYKQVRKELQQSPFKVVSLHNFFPIPPLMSHTGGGGDLFPLSHPNREERNRGIEWTTQSIDHAHELGALAVVLHCGYVDMNPELDRLYYYHNTNQIISKEARVFIDKKIKERERQKAKHLEALLSSLDQLVSSAAKREILLGLENRYHYHELPGIQELEILFKKFKGAPIGYWHDTGHAHANEILSFLPCQSLLQKFSDRLIGIHLHDAIGLKDHLAPGTGEIEFDGLKDYIKSDTLLVMELKPGTPDIEVSRGIHFLRNLGFN